MQKQIYINLPVRDIVASTKFYEALGFTKNPMFSNDQTGNALMLSDDIVVMLLSHDFYKTFINGKDVADFKKTGSALYAISFNSKEEVDKFVETAKSNGGNAYRVNMAESESFMYNFEVEDLDGHIWEPFFMDMSKFTQNNN